mmetsp:Transcript_8988/g.13511  ORF Transcript_8988/g.13511 Transcript_8988/m.13511 type:complete len:224 (+) Transcript_8988:87-758(+)
MADSECSSSSQPHEFSTSKPAPPFAADDSTIDTGSSRKSTLRRTVTWADGTAEPQQVQLAVSIPRHKNIRTLGHTQYVIELWQNGRAWTLKRRYSDFVAFHNKILAEDWVDPSWLPSLPGKGWLSVRRWMNRFDEDFIIRRRQALQEYIRAMVKIETVLERSFALQQFLEINKTRLNSRGRVGLGRAERPSECSSREEEESVEGGRVSLYDTLNRHVVHGHHQ